MTDRPPYEVCLAIAARIAGLDAAEVISTADPNLTPYRRGLIAGLRRIGYSTAEVSALTGKPTRVIYNDVSEYNRETGDHEHAMAVARAIEAAKSAVKGSSAGNAGIYLRGSRVPVREVDIVALARRRGQVRYSSGATLTRGIVE